MITLQSKNDVVKTNEKSATQVVIDASHWSHIYDKHINHMNFLKENDLFTGKRKLEVLENIDNAYAEISKHSNLTNKDDNYDASDNNTNTNVN